MTVGSPPMQSEDSDTPGDGNWEINLALGADWNGDGHRVEFPVADVNYGLGDRVQLTLELPYVSQREAASDEAPAVHAHGAGDATLGLKYRFYDNADRGISMALYPQWRVRAPFTGTVSTARLARMSAWRYFGSYITEASSQSGSLSLRYASTEAYIRSGGILRYHSVS